MTKKTLAVLMDGFAHDYVKHAKFIGGLGGVSRLKPLFGFQPGLVSYLAGVHPDTSKVWNMFVRSNASIYRWTRSLWPLLEVADKIPLLNWATRNFVSLASLKFSGTSYLQTVQQIPFRHLHKFTLSLRHELSEKHALPILSLFDVLYQHRRSFSKVHGNLISLNGRERVGIPPNVSDEKTFSNFRRLLKRNDDFYFVYLTGVDEAGHRFGPRSREIKKKVKEVDGMVSEMADMFRKKTGGQVVVFSDHGMEEVRQSVDVERAVKEAGLKVGKDMDMFLDSMMARFWIERKGAEKDLRKALAGVEGVYRVSEAALRENRVFFRDGRYGEEIYACRPGWMIAPNCFQKGQLKGMHGYTSGRTIEGMFACEQRLKGRMGYVDILPTLLRLMRLKRPETCQGKSALRKG